MKYTGTTRARGNGENRSSITKRRQYEKALLYKMAELLSKKYPGRMYTRDEWERAKEEVREVALREIEEHPVYDRDTEHGSLY